MLNEFVVVAPHTSSLPIHAFPHSFDGAAHVATQVFPLLIGFVGSLQLIIHLFMEASHLDALEQHASPIQVVIAEPEPVIALAPVALAPVALAAAAFDNSVARVLLRASDGGIKFKRS